MIVTAKIPLATQGHCDIIDITRDTEKALMESGISSGTVLVFVPGSTAGVTTIEYEPGLKKDLPEFFNTIIPENRGYHHDAAWGDGNGYAHVRAALLGPSLSVPVADRRLLLGTWQQIVVIDFDNRPRSREIVVQITGEQDAG
ncbi:YjbQ family protein [bacterium]|nr:YjbQ family protein [bacterium]